jgi:signal transduction histidine kinase
MAEPRWPVYATLVGSAAYIAAVQTGSYHPTGNSVADAVIFLITAPVVAVLSVALGLLPARILSLVGLAVLTVALQWGHPDPFPAVITIGFWLVGLTVRSHRRLAGALRVRADELESGRDTYVQEALRYEHIRIARELHDIVAHSLSVIVIQASAGRRLPPDDPDAAELLHTISELTKEVRTDIDGLARLIDDPADVEAPRVRHSIDELLKRTADTGSPVSSTLPHDLDQLPGRITTIVYRIVQEALTNAIKHAPGAPIDVLIATGGDVRITITNTATRNRSSAPAPPAAPGSGRGLAGLTERVHAANGTFASGPTTHGGWQINAELPLTRAAGKIAWQRPTGSGTVQSRCR